MPSRVCNAGSCFQALAASALHEEAFRWLLNNFTRVEVERRRMVRAPAWQRHADQALINAVRWNRYLVKPLLRCGANPAFNQSEALTVAAKMARVEDARSLIARGARADDNESRSLSDGILMGARPMVELLLANNANPTARKSEALHQAGKLNYHDIFELLLDAKADPRARGADTLLAAAAHASVECVATLLARVEYTRDELIAAARCAAPSTFTLIRDRLRDLDSHASSLR